MEHSDALERDISRLVVDGREIVLVGTAHISQESVDVVEWVIDREQPDVVCVELDEQRFRALRSDSRWEDLDLMEVIREGKLTFLLARLALTAFQRQMGSDTGVTPGAEMAAAADAADNMGVPVELVDRNVRTTLLRAWRLTPWHRRMEVAAMLVASLLQTGEVSEDDLSELKGGSKMAELLEELGTVFPEVKKVLVDERDAYMADHIRRADGDKIVAVLGAAHRPGVEWWLRRGVPRERIERSEVVPPKSDVSKAFPWILPMIVLGLFVYGGFTAETDVLYRSAIAWVLANGILSAVGAAAALAHPLTILAAFVGAPLTSLNPSIGAGMTTAFVQVLVASPKVRDFESVGDDLTEWSGWWSNRLARVALVFLFSSIGSVIGTFLAFHWLKELL